MKTLNQLGRLLLGAALFVSCANYPRGHFFPRGTLLIAGGGSTSGEIVSQAIELAGGPEGRILIAPQASESPDAGKKSLEHWQKSGARNVTLLDLSDSKAACAAIAGADLLWMPGGSQNRLMDAFRAAPGVIEAIRERYRSGGTIGGTSAGAAVMSSVMITGEADLDRITAGATKTSEGLGLWPQTIVDQHAIKRGRLNRLLSAVLDRPQLVGVAIDEETAVIVSEGGRRFELIGKAQAVVIDARTATVPATSSGEPAAGDGLRFHLLKAGMSFRL